MVILLLCKRSNTKIAKRLPSTLPTLKEFGREGGTFLVGSPIQQPIDEQDNSNGFIFFPAQLQLQLPERRPKLILF
jgi:hypothetical protein